MDTQTRTLTETGFSIHPATRPGHVHLTVAHLDRQIEFYRRVIGLELHWREGSTAGLGAGGRDVLRLTEKPGAKRYRGTTGLYHFAILLPNRRELARAIGRLFELNYPNYPTDHIFTKTTYLDDPEGQNIELYAESPEDGTANYANGVAQVTRTDGTPSDGREPLDLEALFRELAADDRLDEPMAKETRLGHVHLYVANLDETMHFYHDVLGFDNMGVVRSFRMGMVSAGGYHHHIGFNTWVGEGAPPSPTDALGLRYFSMVLPDRTELDRVLDRIRQAGIAAEQTQEGVLVRDPSLNAIVLNTPAQEEAAAC
jgi:catechol 2,3-dioxygenase